MTGRPIGTTIPINWEQVDSMCAIQCTGEEMAGVLSVDYDTLASACKREKGMLFSEYIEQKRADGKRSLRREQYTTAIDGSVAMQIWLGKNWLGQTDKMEKAISSLPPIEIGLYEA